MIDYGLRDFEERGYTAGDAHVRYVEAYGGDAEEAPDQYDMTDIQYAYYLAGWNQAIDDYANGTDDTQEDNA